MITLQIILALSFMITMVAAKKKWVVILGWVLVFLAGTLLYVDLYSSAMGRTDAGVIVAGIMASARNFFINNDFASYAEKTNAESFFTLNIVYFLSVFMTLLTTAKIIVAHFSDSLRLFIYGKRRHICVFTDSSTETVRLARSVKNSVDKSLCIFIGCDRCLEFESDKNVLFFKTPIYARLKKYETEFFSCSEDSVINSARDTARDSTRDTARNSTRDTARDAAENRKTYERLKKQLPQSRFYYFAEDDAAALNRDELLVRYLFVTDKFVPKRYCGDERAKICVIGDNNLAIELCRELIVQCQSVHGLPQITIIGISAADNFAFFVKSNPELTCCAELLFINEKPNSTAGIDALTNGGYQIYLFCDGNNKLSKLVTPGKVVEMPDYEVIYDYDTIVNYSLDSEAKELNAEYRRNCRSDKDNLINVTIDVDAAWRALTEFERQSNRSLAINISSKKYLRSIGVTQEQLTHEEHLRWNAFHYVNGWVFGKDADGNKDMQRKLHPLLVPYSELPEAEIMKDMMFIKKIFGEDETV